MQDGNMSLQAWRKLAAFQVFGDYAPLAGFRLVMQLRAREDAWASTLEQRARERETLDPDLARCHMRAGLGLVKSGLVSFVYATPEDAVVVVRPEALARGDSPLDIQNQLLAMFSARLSLMVGHELLSEARIYEFPDVTVIRRALCALQEEIEETTPRRSALWLGAQLRGRGHAFHPSMLETIEEQTSLLQSNGVDMDALPSWWWRGVATAIGPDGAVEIFDQLPPGDAFGELVPED